MTKIRESTRTSLKRMLGDYERGLFSPLTPDQSSDPQNLVAAIMLERVNPDSGFYSDGAKALLAERLASNTSSFLLQLEVGSNTQLSLKYENNTLSGVTVNSTDAQLRTALIEAGAPETVQVVGLGRQYTDYQITAKLWCVWFPQLANLQSPASTTKRKLKITPLWYRIDPSPITVKPLRPGGPEIEVGEIVFAAEIEAIGYGIVVPSSSGSSSRPGLVLTKLNPAPAGSTPADVRQITATAVYPLKENVAPTPPAVLNAGVLSPRDLGGVVQADWEFVIKLGNNTTNRLRADIRAADLQTALRNLTNSTTLEVFGRGTAGDANNLANPWNTQPPVVWPFGLFFVRDLADNSPLITSWQINRGWRNAGVNAERFADLVFRQTRVWPRDELEPLDLTSSIATSRLVSPTALVMYSGKTIQQWDRNFE